MAFRATFALLSLLASHAAQAQMLEVYAELTGKTVLAPSALMGLPNPGNADLASGGSNAIARIEAALADRRIEVVQDGPHFVRIFPAEEGKDLASVPLRGAELAAQNGPEKLPPGMINLTQADRNQTLSLYAQMSHRTVLRSVTLPAPVITFKTQCPMSKAEALYALSTVFALNGLCLVEDGPRFVQVVPMSDRQRVKTRAPAPEPGAKLVDPQKVPTIGDSPSRPLTDRERVEHELRRVQKAVYAFVHLPNPEKPPARRLLGLYADLADKTAVPSPKFDGAGIWFQIDQPLTRRELLYAIETTFALHNLAIVPVGDSKVRLDHR